MTGWGGTRQLRFHCSLWHSAPPWLTRLAIVSRWVFPSTLTAVLIPAATVAYVLVLKVDKNWEFQSFSEDLDPQLFIALFLVLQALCALCAVAVAASTRLGQVMTLTVCSMLFLLGLSSEYLFGAHRDEHALAALAYSVVPNLGVH